MVVTMRTIFAVYLTSFMVKESHCFIDLDAANGHVTEQPNLDGRLDIRPMVHEKLEPQALRQRPSDSRQNDMQRIDYQPIVRTRRGRQSKSAIESPVYAINMDFFLYPGMDRTKNEKVVPRKEGAWQSRLLEIFEREAEKFRKEQRRLFRRSGEVDPSLIEHI